MSRARVIAEDMLRSAEARRASMVRTGMQVPYHGPLANAPMSTLKDVEWWAREILSAETESTDDE